MVTLQKAMQYLIVIALHFLPDVFKEMPLSSSFVCGSTKTACLFIFRPAIMALPENQITLKLTLNKI